jgi:hypothetical protein
VPHSPYSLTPQSLVPHLLPFPTQSDSDSQSAARRRPASIERAAGLSPSSAPPRSIHLASAAKHRARVHPAATAPFADLLGAAGGHRAPSPTFCTPVSGHRAPSWPPASSKGRHGPDSTSCAVPRAICAPSPTSCSSPSSQMRRHGHLHGPPPSPSSQAHRRMP